MERPDTSSLPVSRWFVVSRLIAATLVCLIVLGITFPNLGRPDLSGLSPRRIVYGWPDALCIAIIIVPLLIVFLGAAFSLVTETVGWVLLLAILALRFAA